MKDIPLTNHQLIAFFLPGLLFVFCFFITFTHVNSIKTLICSLENLNIAFLIVAIILSFIIGLVFDAIRNVLFDEKIFKRRERNNAEINRLNWDFFYTGKREEVGV